MLCPRPMPVPRQLRFALIAWAKGRIERRRQGPTSAVPQQFADIPTAAIPPFSSHIALSPPPIFRPLSSLAPMAFPSSVSSFSPRPSTRANSKSPSPAAAESGSNRAVTRSGPLVPTRPVGAGATRPNTPCPSACGAARPRGGLGRSVHRSAGSGRSTPVDPSRYPPFDPSRRRGPEGGLGRACVRGVLAASASIDRRQAWPRRLMI